MNTKISFLFSLFAITQKILFFFATLDFFLSLSLFSDDVDDGHLQEGNYHIIFHHISGSTLHKNDFLALQVAFDLFTTLYRSFNEVLEFFTFDQLFLSLLSYNKNRKNHSSISWLIRINFI